MLRGFLWLTAACGFVLSMMVLLCSEAGAAFLLYALERQSTPVEARQLREVQAIVVLGGRTNRVHYAAALHRQTGLPLFLAGKGTGDHPFAAESQKMEQMLRDQYGIAARWVETESIDTLQNAQYTACMLQGTGVRRIALLTDPVHMPRSRALFLAAGFTVVAAPAPDAPERATYPLTVDSFVPTSVGIDAARYPVKEWAGMFIEPVQLVARRGECTPAGAVH
jgi:uncharacterized SAM-binding protein YcdF (DUF218 family)